MLTLSLALPAHALCKERRLRLTAMVCRNRPSVNRHARRSDCRRWHQNMRAQLGREVRPCARHPRLRDIALARLARGPAHERLASRPPCARSQRSDRHRRAAAKAFANGRAVPRYAPVPAQNGPQTSSIGPVNSSSALPPEDAPHLVQSLTPTLRPGKFELHGSIARRAPPRYRAARQRVVRRNTTNALPRGWSPDRLIVGVLNWSRAAICDIAI